MSTFQNSGPRGPPLETLVDEGDPDILFDLIEEIAQGSYGHVFKAVYKKDGTICALKIIALEEDETFDDLKVEIALLKQCSHKNIVKYVGSWKKGEELFIAMELCDGGSLDKILELRKKGLNEAQLALIARESLLGLQYLHGNNILHRDIKAANILMTSNGEVKLVDFGVSVITEEGQKRLTFIGSPYWMAPEVIDNRTLPSPYDFKADIWSLGITMIELAENRVPLAELQPMAALRQIPRKDPPKLSEESKWSSEFKDFIDKCLQKEPDDRHSSEQLLSHPFISNCKPIGVLVDLISEYQKYLEELELTSEESSEDNLNVSTNITSETSEVSSLKESGGGDTLKFVPTQNNDTNTQIDTQDSETNESKKKKKNLDSEKDIENFNELDEEEKQMLKSTLRDAQKKNRPVSLRKGNVVEELQKVKDAQILKQQLKAAKTQQANQLKERTNMEKNQKNEMKELEKSFLNRLTKLDTKYKKDVETKTRNDKTDKENLLKKHETNNRNLHKQHETNTKNLQNSAREKQNEIRRKNQTNQKTSDRIFKQYQKNQKKDKKKDKKQVASIQKRHELIFEQKELQLNTEMNQMMERDYTQLVNQQQLHQNIEKNNIRLPQFRHMTLSLIHSIQIQVHIDQVNLYSKHEILTEQNNSIRELALTHLTQLQELELEQQKQNHNFEKEQQSKDQQKEQKAEFRKFKQNQKNEAKVFEREKKKELSRIKISRKETKTQMENEKRVFMQQQKADEMEFMEKLKWVHEEQDKQLNEYQLDQRERLLDLHDRAKKKKQQDNEQQKLNDKQKFKEEKLETYKNQRISLFLEAFSAFKAEREFLAEAQRSEKGLQETHHKQLEKLQRENLGHFQAVNAQEIERQNLALRHQKQNEQLEADHKVIIEKILSFRNEELIKQLYELQCNPTGELKSTLSSLTLTEEIPDMNSEVLSQQKDSIVDRQKKEIEALLSEAEKSHEVMREHQKNEGLELESFLVELEDQLIEIHKESELALIEELDNQFQLLPKKEK